MTCEDLQLGVLTTLFDEVHGIQLGPGAGPSEVRHGMGRGELVRAGEQRPLGLRFRPGFRRRASGPLVGLRVARGGARQDGRRRVAEAAAVVFAPLHFVLELGEGRTGLLLHGEVEHAGRHVVPHELDAHLDASSFFPLLGRLGLQSVPTEMRVQDAEG